MEGPAFCINHSCSPCYAAPDKSAPSSPADHCWRGPWQTQQKEADKVSILKQLFALLGHNGVLIQYTYSAKAPIAPILATRFGIKGTRMTTIFRNLPPARVWKYCRDHEAEVQ